MEKKEFAKIAMALKAYYPQDGFLTNDAAKDAWYFMLKDIPYEILSAAVQKWVANNKWMPSVAEIRAIATEIMFGEIPDWGAGWKEVVNALNIYGHWSPKEALDSMSEITREVVNRMGYGNLCRSENSAADRANFRLIYEELSEKKKVERQLPQHTQAMLTSINQRLLEAGDDNNC